MSANKRIIQHLVDNDKRFKIVTRLCSYPRSRKNSDIYMALLSSIASQQLSVKAADTIFNRFLDIFPERYPDPQTLVKTREQRLRNAGLSRQKAEYMKNVARFALQDEGLNFYLLKSKKDDELVDYLTQIKGVGRWTVEMLLMFTLDRKDVFPVDDLGIQQAMRRLYGLQEEGRVFRSKMIDIAESWRPYRSIACKYLWQWKSLP